MVPIIWEHWGILPQLSQTSQLYPLTDPHHQALSLVMVSQFPSNPTQTWHL
ncbi:hypothetical protein KZX29_06675 [Moraxella osloensis]|uniref:hypothetical protein n=1 Tax=Faucicola osloensis TaxID=34062 RepID=UPI002004EEFC|nr:hypothetical protein [Moraxella osloensis]MCK6157804.1 hypothetical protein [Moraxella osloensis]MCK6158480.1 hypothetical protein [Moraxella osloensis]